MNPQFNFLEGIRFKHHSLIGLLSTRYPFVLTGVKKSVQSKSISSTFLNQEAIEHMVASLFNPQNSAGSNQFV